MSGDNPSKGSRAGEIIDTSHNSEDKYIVSDEGVMYDDEIKVLG